MKRIFITTLLIISTLTIYSQENELIEKIKTANQKVSSITATFVQTKHFPLMNQEIESEGNLYFEDTKMSLKYTKPEGDIMLINGDSFVMNANGKKQSVNAKTNAQIAELKNLLLTCMKCDINKIVSDFNGVKEYTSTATSHLFTLIRDKKGKKGFYKIILNIDTKSLTLNALEMHEMNDNYTVYKMQNKQFNQKIEDSVFQVQK